MVLFFHHMCTPQYHVKTVLWCRVLILDYTKPVCVELITSEEQCMNEFVQLFIVDLIEESYLFWLGCRNKIWQLLCTKVLVLICCILLRCLMNYGKRFVLSKPCILTNCCVFAGLGSLHHYDMGLFIFILIKNMIKYLKYFILCEHGISYFLQSNITKHGDLLTLYLYG